jgi:hypothetical protein
MDFELTSDMDAPAEVVWEVLGEQFGSIAEWTSLLTSSELEGDLAVGAVRHCRFPPDLFSKRGHFRERLVHFDRDARELAYVALDNPWFMRRAGSRFRITALPDGRTRVTVRGELALHPLAIPMAPILRIMIRRMGLKLLADLRSHLVTQTKTP